MSIWQAAILGAIQGLTEFLPVSSSGHLALAQIVMERLGVGFEQPGVVFDAFLHLGTAAAIVWYERLHIRRWLGSKAGWRLAGLLAIGTAATAAVAFPLREAATAAFSNLIAVGAGLIVTACVVGATQWLGPGRHDEAQTSWWQAVVVGLAQGVAVFPGVSRSGMTIASGLASGIERGWVARFSFLLSVPAVLGATTVELLGQRQGVVELGSTLWLPYLVGSLAAGLSGFVALQAVIHALSSRVFHRFAWYCLPLGIASLLWAWWTP